MMAAAPATTTDRVALLTTNQGTIFRIPAFRWHQCVQIITHLRKELLIVIQGWLR
jgi:hypothetical protein